MMLLMLPPYRAAGYPAPLVLRLDSTRGPARNFPTVWNLARSGKGSQPEGRGDTPGVSERVNICGGRSEGEWIGQIRYVVCFHIVVGRSRNAGGNSRHGQNITERGYLE